ncbi:MAG: DUF4956 domain-containing protein [Saprospiraceae bacterium]|nr:DUF4956 domain-containing protein [Saprospiraceae bacterium]
MPDISTFNGTYNENTIAGVIFSVLMTILLSLFLVFTYDKTTPILNRSQSFIQALLLMSIVTSTIMQSIGDSLALSFGIFGALAIIRFRSFITDPRDIAFMFATMAIGIACGVHSYLNAVIGTVTFCIIIFVLKLTPFSNSSNIKGNIRVDLGNDPSKLSSVENLLLKSALSSRLVRYRVTINPDGTEMMEYEFAFIVRNIIDGTKLQGNIHEIPGIKINRLTFEDNVYLSGTN